jgi:hypothetical protein
MCCAAGRRVEADANIRVQEILEDNNAFSAREFVRDDRDRDSAGAGASAASAAAAAAADAGGQAYMRLATAHGSAGSESTLVLMQR